MERKEKKRKKLINWTDLFRIPGRGAGKAENVEDVAVVAVVFLPLGFRRTTRHNVYLVIQASFNQPHQFGLDRVTALFYP